MKDAIVIIAVLGAMGFGYVLMGWLGNFLNEHRKAIGREDTWQEPACMMLTDDMSDEELTREIRAFRSSHEGMRIMLYEKPADVLKEKQG